MSFLHVLADFTACQPLGNLRSRSEREREREERGKEGQRKRMEERREKRRGGRDREMGEEKKDCKKKKKKGQHGSRGVNARINRAFVEGNKKKICMDGRWIFDFYKKKKSV